MRIGQDLTRDTSLEARQYELLGMDLGDGISRRMGGILAILCFVWIGLLLLILGAPSPQTIILYLLPPGVIGFFGARPNNQQDRRVNLTQWALKVRQFFVGHKPIINLGRTAPTRREWMPVSDRVDASTLWHSFYKDQDHPIAYKQIQEFTFNDRPVDRLIESNRHPVMLYGEEILPKARTRGTSRKVNDEGQG
jgi:hypothetical protein